MARVTVEDCLRRTGNRFMLVHAAAKRVRQMREGAQYLVHSPKNEDIVIALRELAAGKVHVREYREAVPAPKMVEAPVVESEAHAPEQKQEQKQEQKEE